MRYLKKIPMAVFIVLSVLISWLLASNRNADSPTDGEPKSSLFKVSVLEMHQTPEPLYLSLFGHTEAAYSISPKSRASGILSSTPIEEGALVDTGDVLAIIAEENHINKLKAATSAYNVAQLEAQNAGLLKKEGARSTVNMLRSISALKRAEADLKTAQLDVQHLQIKAPFKGVVSQYAIKEGAYVVPGEVVIQSLDALDPLIAVVHVSQFDRDKVYMGQEAVVIFSNGYAVLGTVSFVASNAEKSTRSYRVQVKISNKDYKYLAGTSVTVRIMYDKLPVYKLPTQSISLSDDGTLGVKVVGEKNCVLYKPIELLYAADNFFYVRGLSENERIIVNGHAFVVPGEKVDPIIVSNHMTEEHVP